MGIFKGGDSMQPVKVIGAGLAGSEAAYQLAKRGIPVDLYEMRPKKSTPAHSTGLFGELVCSNSLRSNQLKNAVGVLKEEMRMLDSLILKAADATSLEAGGALAVDREEFSKYITKTLKSIKHITVVEEEVTEIPKDTPVIVASGPLTSDALFASVQTHTDKDSLYFFDAVAPIVSKDTIDFSIAYYKNRYEDGEGDYINCPMDKSQYDRFYRALVASPTVDVRDFEDRVFEACMPIETMAKRGKDTLRFGPMKPVGLEKDADHKPYAVVQLRKDDARGNLYNLVGFQTHLTFPAQRKLLRMIPGLENVEIVRYGVMHRNTFLNAPKHLQATYQSRHDDNIFFAGQITGVEGYVESAASGLIAGINMARKLSDKALLTFPKTTVMGAQADYIATANPKQFQPMNANFGLLPALEVKLPKLRRKEAYAERALDAMRAFRSEIDEGL